jgi:hypothetical protein
LCDKTGIPADQLRAILLQLEQAKQIAFHADPFKAWEHTWTVHQAER